MKSKCCPLHSLRQRPPYVVVTGIDTVEVQTFNVDLLGECCFAEAEELLALVGLCPHENRPQGWASQESQVGQSEKQARGLREVLRYRSVWLCAVNGALLMTFLSIGLGYLPLFYIKDQAYGSAVAERADGSSRDFEPGSRHHCAAIADRVGRKPVAIVSSLFGLLCPLAALYCPGPLGILGLLMFVGWMPAGPAFLHFGAIPSESMPAGAISTAMGLTLAVGTLVGGVAGPSVAGWSADHWGLPQALWLEARCAATMAVLSLALLESAPGKGSLRQRPVVTISIANRKRARLMFGNEYVLSQPAYAARHA